MADSRAWNSFTFDKLFVEKGCSPVGSAPHLTALRDEIRAELLEMQREFNAKVEQRLQEAMNADKQLAAQQVSRGSDSEQEPQTEVSSSWWPTNGPYRGLMQMMTFSQDEPTEVQCQWQENWLVEVEDGQLDIYTCLGLSDACSWTPDTRRLMMNAIAVFLMQLVCPLCLLKYETSHKIELGPAVDGLAFRLVGAICYAYAIYLIYTGADSKCRTLLLNMMFHFKNIHIGRWLPLVFGELTNVFTAIVLVFALYSIFTTQTQPADLILNAVAVNFLCDCDAAFVDRWMKADAVETFKTFSREQFTSQESHTEDPFTLMWPTKVSKVAHKFICFAGMLGCTCFLVHAAHAYGQRDVAPGFSHHVVDFGDGN